MKFLCEHCKAKYQIADEKVAGRTVRMKCRKCGNPIEVRAAVTETSVNAKIPTEPPPPNNPGGAPRPGRTPLATSLSAAAKPAPARPAAPRAPEGGNLAGAFHRNVQQKEEESISVALDMRELSAADEWYVAINGVPVGPIRVAELRRKAAIGVVNEDSLCWQEGMEEWRPVRAVAELAALVREAAVGGRVSLVTPPPPDARPNFGAPPARPGSVRPHAPPAAPRAPRPAAAPAPSAWSNVVPITSRLATAERLNEEPARLDAPPAHSMLAPDPFATPPGPAPFQAPPPSGAGAVEPVSAPFPLTTAAPSIAPPPREERRATPFMAIAMIVLAAAFGVTAAIVIFLKPAPPPPPVVVQVPAASPPPQTAPTPTAAPPAPTDSTAAAAPTATGAPGKVAAAPTKTGSGAGGKPGATAVTDPSLRDLIAGAANGPAAGPSPGSGGGASAELTADQVQSVLQSHQVGLKRTCWDRVQTSSSTVNEMLHVVVGSGGQVSSASATGNDPVVGHCIEGEVRRWSFPGSGEINIPFHFLRQ